MLFLGLETIIKNKIVSATMPRITRLPVIKTFSWVGWHLPVIPVVGEAVTGGL